MDFISFISNQSFLFWTFLFLACLFAYLVSVLKVILFDVRDTKLAYGPYCKNLKLLYKPYKQCFREAFIMEWKTMVLFIVLYVGFSYYQFG